MIVTNFKMLVLARLLYRTFIFRSFFIFYFVIQASKWDIIFFKNLKTSDENNTSPSESLENVSLLPSESEPAAISEVDFVKKKKWNTIVV